MYFKLFIPVFLLSFIQLSAFFLYNGFTFNPSGSTEILISSFYLSLILAIFTFSIFVSKNFKPLTDSRNNSNVIVDYIALIITILFILKPTLIMYGMGVELGFDYVRQNFFTSDVIRSKAFGNMSLAIFTQNYVVAFLWFYIIYLIGFHSKRSNVIFYCILISLILFNMSYAGRFNIYFAIIVLYIKNVLEGKKLFDFIKKYFVLILALFSMSTIIVAIRNNREGFANNFNDILKVLEYHILQPFFVAQKIDNNQIIVDGYPFRVIIEGFFAPLLYLFNIELKDLPQGYYSRVFGDSTLYSQYTETYYNAFSTLFPYIYIDFGLMSPIFCFIIVFIFFSFSFLISGSSLRAKYLSYLSLMLYFSLFQAPIFSHGVLFIVIIVPLLSYLGSKFNRGIKS